MTRNLVIGEALWVLEKNTHERGTETNANYKLVMEDLITDLFPPNALQRQKRYLRRGVYKTHKTKIWEFICRIEKMVDYLKKFPSFGIGQGLLDDEILQLVEFLLPGEWQKELIIKGFDSATQSLTELVELCEILETANEIFHMQGEGRYQNK